MSPRIAVSRMIPEAALTELREVGDVVVPEEDRARTPAELRELVAGADALVAMMHDQVNAELVDAAGPQLRVVANIAVGYDNIDVAALADRGVLVTNTPGVLTDATADLTLGLLLALTRRLGEGERLLRARQPWQFHLSFMLGTGMRDKMVGIIGFGEIGQAVARRARAFGCHIVYTQRHRADPEVERQLDAQYLSPAQLRAQADVVSVHCPLTEETRHLIDAAALGEMKPSAVLVNTSRGPVVDEAALADALKSGELAGAALDVFEREPDVHPELLDRDDVVLTPHLGSATVETRTAMATLAARNVRAVLAGENPPTPVRSG